MSVNATSIPELAFVSLIEFPPLSLASCFREVLETCTPSVFLYTYLRLENIDIILRAIFKVGDPMVPLLNEEL